MFRGTIGDIVAGPIRTEMKKRVNELLEAQERANVALAEHSAALRELAEAIRNNKSVPGETLKAVVLMAKELVEYQKQASATSVEVTRQLETTINKLENLDKS